MLKSIFFLSRPLNQLFIIITMVLVRMVIVANHSLTAQFSVFNFVLLIVSVVFISAAGYIINDYFDVKTDEINKPNKIYIGRSISRRHAMIAHNILSISGLSIASYLSLQAENWFLFLFHLGAWAALWYYSVNLKKLPFIGNFIVSVLTALPIVVVFAYEFWAKNSYKFDSTNALHLVLLYATFAFLVNLAREIIKDCEDIEGDKLINANTIPIKYGLTMAKQAVAVILFCIPIILVVFLYNYEVSFSKLIEVAVALGSILFAGFLIMKSFGADHKQDFSKISNYLKIVMFFGILSMLIFL